jgi:hypothetical protein
VKKYSRQAYRLSSGKSSVFHNVRALVRMKTFQRSTSCSGSPWPQSSMVVKTEVSRQDDQSIAAAVNQSISIRQSPVQDADRWSANH